MQDRKDAPHDLDEEVHAALVVQVEFPALGAVSLLHFDVRRGLEHKVLAGVSDLIDGVCDGLADHLVSVDSDGSQRKLEQLRHEAVEGMKTWQGELCFVNGWKMKVKRASDTMNRMREAYFRELSHLREQVYQMQMADTAGTYFEPSYAIHFDPVDYQLDDTAVRLCREKMGLLQQEFDAKLRDHKLQYEDRFSVLTGKLRVANSLVERKDELLDSIMARHGYDSEDLAVKVTERSAEAKFAEVSHTKEVHDFRDFLVGEYGSVDQARQTFAEQHGLDDDMGFSEFLRFSSSVGFAKRLGELGMGADDMRRYFLQLSNGQLLSTLRTVLARADEKEPLRAVLSEEVLMQSFADASAKISRLASDASARQSTAIREQMQASEQSRVKDEHIEGTKRMCSKENSSVMADFARAFDLGSRKADTAAILEFGHAHNFDNVASKLGAMQDTPRIPSHSSLCEELLYSKPVAAQSKDGYSEVVHHLDSTTHQEMGVGTGPPESFFPKFKVHTKGIQSVLAGKDVEEAVAAYMNKVFDSPASPLVADVSPSPQGASSLFRRANRRKTQPTKVPAEIRESEIVAAGTGEMPPRLETVSVGVQAEIQVTKVEVTGWHKVDKIKPAPSITKLAAVGTQCQVAMTDTGTQCCITSIGKENEAVSEVSSQCNVVQVLVPAEAPGSSTTSLCRTLGADGLEEVQHVVSAAWDLWDRLPELVRRAGNLLDQGSRAEDVKFVLEWLVSLAGTLGGKASKADRPPKACPVVDYAVELGVDEEKEPPPSRMQLGDLMKRHGITVESAEDVQQVDADDVFHRNTFGGTPSNGQRGFGRRASGQVLRPPASDRERPRPRSPPSLNIGNAATVSVGANSSGVATSGESSSVPLSHITRSQRRTESETHNDGSTSEGASVAFRRRQIGSRRLTNPPSRVFSEELSRPVPDVVTQPAHPLPPAQLKVARRILTDPGDDISQRVLPILTAASQTSEVAGSACIDLSPQEIGSRRPGKAGHDPSRFASSGVSVPILSPSSNTSPKQRQLSDRHTYGCSSARTPRKPTLVPKDGTVGAQALVVGGGPFSAKSLARPKQNPCDMQGRATEPATHGRITSSRISAEGRASDYGDSSGQQYADIDGHTDRDGGGEDMFMLSEDHLPMAPCRDNQGARRPSLPGIATVLRVSVAAVTTRADLAVSAEAPNFGLLGV